MRRIDVSEAPQPSTQEPLPELMVVMTVATFALMPILRGSTLWAASGGAPDPLRSVSLSLYQLPLLALVAMALRAVLTRKISMGGRWSLISVLVTTSAVWVLLALAVRPSWRGLDWVVHVLAAAVIGWVVARMQRGQAHTVVGAFVVLTAVQGAFGVSQSLNGSTFGIELIEYKQDLVEFGSQVAGKGSFGHPYHLATMLLVGVAAIYFLAERSDRRSRPALLVAATAVGFALPFTYSRAMILSVAAVFLVAALARDRDLRQIAIVLAAGMATAFVLTASGGWSAKAEKSLGDRADSGRIELAEDAIELLTDEPVFGIGLGRYVIEQSSRTGVVSNPPHNAVLHAGAEMGLPGLLLVAALVGASGWWAVRSGTLAVIVWVAPMPMFLLDHFPYTSPRGIAISGFWIGLLIRTIIRRD